jgi:4-hydroxythreonine-4-phosphate dehydrogenase
MILFTGKLRVALATIHVPLKEVPDLIDFNTILNRMKIFYGSLINDFAIEKPKIAVLGLNPHAGENGDIGREEIESIIPAIEEFNKSSELACGPFSADGFFAHRMDREFDGILAMYHDQGLIPMKLLANGGGVNFTAGLPIVRTSPSHGTAFDIAGKGTADEKSALDAIIAAVNIAKNRNKH